MVKRNSLGAKVILIISNFKFSYQPENANFVQTTVEIIGKFSVEHRRKTLLAVIFQRLKTSGRKGLPTIPAEKSRELQRDMHIAFVDSTKAYDTVNQNFSIIS